MIRRPPRSTLSSSSAASDVYKRQTRKGRLGAWECTGDDGRRGPLGGRDGAVWRRPGLPGGGLWGPPGAAGVGPGPRCPWRGRPGSAAAAPIGVCGLPAHPGAAAGERAARTRTGAASSDVVSFPDGSAQVVEDPVSLDTTSTRLPDALAWAAAAATSSTGGVAAGVGVGAAVGAGAAGVGAGVGSDGLGVAVVGAVAAGGDSAGAVATADPTGYSPSTRRALSRRSPTGAAERTPQDPTAQDRTRQPPPRARTGKGRMPSSRGALVGYLGGSPPPP